MGIPFSNDKQLEKVRVLIEHDLSAKDLKDKNLPTIYTKMDNKIVLQFWGWAIVLLENGEWFFEDTSGG